jgi:hypothetical protein
MDAAVQASHALHGGVMGILFVPLSRLVMWMRAVTSKRKTAAKPQIHLE